MSEPCYIGDAVYADFDGWQLWLRTGDGNNNEVALEPAVWQNLIDYLKRVRANYNEADRAAFDRMFPLVSAEPSP